MICTVPADSAGAIAEMTPSESTEKLVAATLPNMTDVTPIKLVPPITTCVPPLIEPTVVDRPVTVGICDWNVNSSEDDVDEVPALLMTAMSTVPAARAGAIAVIEVGEVTVNDVAATFPNMTFVTSVK